MPDARVRGGRRSGDRAASSFSDNAYPEAGASIGDALTTDGWFRTDDLGEFDTDNELRIVDRLEDLIIRGGYNVYPGEVEGDPLPATPISLAAAIGVPDDHYG